MHRLFVALRLPEEPIALLEATMEGVPGARWQTEEQLHCTLRFIGEVERPLAEDIAHGLSGVRGEPLELRLSGVGRFGDRRAGALWAGLVPREPLTALASRVDRLCVKLGLEPERRAYHPHVTVARYRVGQTGPIEPWLERWAGLISPAFAVDSFVLVESRLARDGAHYEDIARYPLR